MFPYRNSGMLMHHVTGQIIEPSVASMAEWTGEAASMYILEHSNDSDIRMEITNHLAANNWANDAFVAYVRTIINTAILFAEQQRNSGWTGSYEDAYYSVIEVVTDGAVATMAITLGLDRAYYNMPQVVHGLNTKANEYANLKRTIDQRLRGMMRAPMANAGVARGVGSPALSGGYSGGSVSTSMPVNTGIQQSGSTDRFAPNKVMLPGKPIDESTKGSKMQGAPIKSIEEQFGKMPQPTKPSTVQRVKVHTSAFNPATQIVVDTCRGIRIERIVKDISMEERDHRLPTMVLGGIVPKNVVKLETPKLDTKREYTETVPTDNLGMIYHTSVESAACELALTQHSLVCLHDEAPSTGKQKFALAKLVLYKPAPATASPHETQVDNVEEYFNPPEGTSVYQHVLNTLKKNVRKGNPELQASCNIINRHATRAVNDLLSNRLGLEQTRIDSFLDDFEEACSEMKLKGTPVTNRALDVGLSWVFDEYFHNESLVGNDEQIIENFKSVSQGAPMCITVARYVGMAWVPMNSYNLGIDTASDKPCLVDNIDSAEFYAFLKACWPVWDKYGFTSSYLVTPDTVILEVFRSPYDPESYIIKVVE